MVSAIVERVDCIVTSNVNDFPPRIGNIRVLKPGAFLAELDQAASG